MNFQTYSKTTMSDKEKKPLNEDDLFDRLMQVGEILFKEGHEAHRRHIIETEIKRILNEDDQTPN